MVENDCVNCSSYKDRGPNIASFEVFFFFFFMSGLLCLGYYHNQESFFSQL